MLSFNEGTLFILEDLLASQDALCLQEAYCLALLLKRQGYAKVMKRNKNIYFFDCCFDMEKSFFIPFFSEKDLLHSKAFHRLEKRLAD